MRARTGGRCIGADIMQGRALRAQKRKGGAKEVHRRRAARAAKGRCGGAPGSHACAPASGVTEHAEQCVELVAAALDEEVGAHVALLLVRRAAHHALLDLAAAHVLRRVLDEGACISIQTMYACTDIHT